MPALDESPWWSIAGGRPSAYVNRGKRFLRKEATVGRLRVVVIGGKKEAYTTAAWLDQWMMAHASTPAMPIRRRA